MNRHVSAVTEVMSRGDGIGSTGRERLAEGEQVSIGIDEREVTHAVVLVAAPGIVTQDASA